MISAVVARLQRSAVIGRLLDRLVSSARPGELDVIVVANGCMDKMAEGAGALQRPDVLAAARTGLMPAPCGKPV